MVAWQVTSASLCVPGLLGIPKQPLARPSLLDTMSRQRQRPELQHHYQRRPTPSTPGRGPLRPSASAVAVPGTSEPGCSVERAPENTVDLCVFPVWAMPLPNSSSSLSVSEPHLLDLLQVVQDVAASSPDHVPACFAAMPYDWVQRQCLPHPGTPAPSSLPYLSDTPPSSFGELSQEDQAVVGCACQIDAALEEPSGDGHWLNFNALRRLKPLRVLRRQPFLVVRGVWLDDAPGPTPVNGVSAGELEQQLWAMIQDVVHCTARLHGNREAAPCCCCGGPDAALPDSVCKFSPQAPPRPTTAEERVRAWSTNPGLRVPAEVAVWRSMKPSTGVTPKPVPAVTEPIPLDPYRAACERLSKTVRQEAFSFAAASIVELGPAQRLELLSMTNTAERLAWLLQAFEPHLAKLRAECSMRQAMGDL